MQSQPVEVVETILRYVISVPILFDLEGLIISHDQAGMMASFYGERRPLDSVLADEREYWEAERYRNACRRVCKAWDAYLRPFEHRLVRFYDIIGIGAVPVESLSRALFISLIHGPYRSSSNSSFIAALHQLDKPTQIRTIFSPYESLSQPEFTILAQQAPHLTTAIFAWGFLAPLERFPALVHASISFSRNAELQILSALPKTLRSLLIRMGVINVEMAELNEASVAVTPPPSLEFLSLSIWGSYDPVPLVRILLSTLGSVITMLQIHLEIEFLVGINDLLDLCPNIQVIHMTTDPQYGLSFPSSQRQLNTLVVALPLVGLKSPGMYEGRLVWPGWPQISRIISADRWPKLQTWPLSDLTLWAAEWKESSVQIEDRDGVSIHEWLDTQTT